MNDLHQPSGYVQPELLSALREKGMLRYSKESPQSIYEGNLLRFARRYSGREVIIRALEDTLKFLKERDEEVSPTIVDEIFAGKINGELPTPAEYFRVISQPSLKLVLPVCNFKSNLHKDNAPEVYRMPNGIWVGANSFGTFERDAQNYRHRTHGTCDPCLNHQKREVGITY